MISPLKGYLQSGILFIGDPGYMSGDTREGADNSACNPFINWDDYTVALDGKDANMLMPNAYEPTQIGRGVSVQTGLINGQYTVEKVFDEAGKLSHIIIKVLP